jgi:hypothetical protein
MLSHAKLDHEFWGEAVNYANYVRERVPTRTSDREFSSPYERRTGDKLDVRHVKVFGCKCLEHVPHQKRKKLDHHAWAGILLGIEGYDTYRVYDPRSGKVEIVRNVQFDESEFPGEGEEPADSDSSCDVSTEDSGSRGMPEPVNSNSDDDSESYGEDGDDSESYGENGDDSESYGEAADNEASQGELSKEIRRPKRERSPPERYTAGANLALKAASQISDMPRATYALKSEDADYATSWTQEYHRQVCRDQRYVRRHLDQAVKRTGIETSEGTTRTVSSTTEEGVMDVLYIRRSLAWIHAIVFGHVSEFQHIRVKTNLEAARMCIWSYTMHLIAST